MPFKDETREKAASFIQQCIDDPKGEAGTILLNLMDSIENVLKDKDVDIDKKEFVKFQKYAIALSKSIDAINNAIFDEEELTDEAAKKKERAKAKKAFEKAVKNYKDLSSSFDNAFKMLDKNELEYNLVAFTKKHFDDLFSIETVHTENTIRKFGQRKTAAAWIEETQKKLNTIEDVTIDDIATIIAARQLGNAVAGDPANINKTYISEADLNERVAVLKADETFREFLAVNQRGKNLDYSIDLDINEIKKRNFTFKTDLVTDGHGGKLEKKFAEFVANKRDTSYTFDNVFYSKDSKRLERKLQDRISTLDEKKERLGDNSCSYEIIRTDEFGEKLENAVKIRETHKRFFPDILYSRYPKKVVEKTTYNEATKNVLKDYTGKNGKVKITPSSDYAAARAATVLAAYSLSLKGERIAVDELAKTKKEILEAPDFKFMRRHRPESLNLLTTGNVEGYLKEVKTLMGPTYEEMQKNEKKATDPAEKEKYSYDVELHKERVARISQFRGLLPLGIPYGSKTEKIQRQEYLDTGREARSSYRFLSCLTINEKNVNLETGNEIATLLKEYVTRDKPEDPANLRNAEVQSILNLVDSHINVRHKLNEGLDLTEYTSIAGEILEAGKKFINPPKFTDKDGKSADELLKEYKRESAKEFFNSIEKYGQAIENEHKNDYALAISDIKSTMDEYHAYDPIKDKYTLLKNKPIEEGDMQEIRNAFEIHTKGLKNAKKNNVKGVSKYIDSAKEVEKYAQAYFNPPEFKDKKGKSAAKQLEEYKQKAGRQYVAAAWKYLAKFEADEQKKLEEVTAKAVANIPYKPAEYEYPKDTPSFAANGMLIDSKRQTYLSKRGPKYRKMYEASVEYDNSNGSPVATMKLIDAILDYQNGKEKATGLQGNRFIDSMRMLAVVTVGTNYEKYFTEQLDRVNKIRGAKPGSKNYLAKEDVFDEFEVNIARAAEKNKANKNDKKAVKI